MAEKKIYRRLRPPRHLYPLSLIICLIPLIMPILSGCSSTKNKGHEKRQYTIRLKWLFNASTLGEIWAKENGIFKAYGFNVQLKEGGAEQDALTEIELGRADFGIASADQIFRAVSKGAHIVVLAQVFQKNPLQWIYIRERTAIKNPVDLKGKTIGITFGGNDEAIFRAIMGEFGLTEKDLTLYAVHYDYAPFWRGEVDLWPVYRNTQGVFLSERIRQQGETPGFFDPYDLGVAFVANSLVTSKDMANRHKKVIEAFTRAVLEGWREALLPENIDKAVALLKKYAPATPKDILRRQIKETMQMVIPKDERPIGTIDIRSWKKTLHIMKAQGLIKGKVDLKDLFPLSPP